MSEKLPTTILSKPNKNMFEKAYFVWYVNYIYNIYVITVWPSSTRNSKRPRLRINFEVNRELFGDAFQLFQ